jgi:hypothetical protein
MIVYHFNMPSGALAFTGATDELAILGRLPYPRPHLLDTRLSAGGGWDRKSRSRNNCFPESRIRATFTGSRDRKERRAEAAVVEGKRHDRACPGQARA